MTNGPPSPSGDGRSRRSLLAAGATLAATAAAGCLGSVLDSSGPQEIDPEEPSDPREGTPGEFYTLVERNDIEVESLVLDGEDLLLEYHSDADDEEASLDEIATITTVFRENLVENDAEIEMLVAEIVDPFEGQAWGWGAEADWFRLNDQGEMTDMSLWNSIISSRVYEADVDDDVDHEYDDELFDDLEDGDEETGDEADGGGEGEGASGDGDDDGAEGDGDEGDESDEDGGETDGAEE